MLPLRIGRARALRAVLRLAQAPPRPRYGGLAADYILHQVVRTTRRPLLMRRRRCLRQGILAYRFMAAAGHRCELHFGIDRTSLADGPQAHCWLVVNGKPVLNPPTPDMVRIFVHPSSTADGQAIAENA
ncbi:MAG: lasso peptide biosynthesis B2 protein [Hyphomicrobiales bacterium]|nr:lasso peptide biosynthesis B2 protein [Hyphomicrobiales bacterium]